MEAATSAKASALAAGAASKAETDARPGERVLMERRATRVGRPQLGSKSATMGLRPSLSDHENLAVGIVGGCVETVALMPVLTWKFCLQEGRPYPPFPHMYRGVSVVASSVAPITGVQMFCNGIFESLLTGGVRAASDTETIGCALGAGAVSASLYGPVELSAIHQQKLGFGLMPTLSHLVKEHGLLSLWRGVAPTAAREAIYTAGYLGLAPVFTKMLMRQDGWEESFFASAVLGSCGAGIIGSGLSHPIDTAKTVVQADIQGTRYPGGTLQALRELYQAEGIAGFYRGGIARTIRTCGAFFIVSTIREKCIMHKAATAAAVEEANRKKATK
jgi:solute carrier family 25 2-oxodicarboxylate transporter 21